MKTKPFFSTSRMLFLASLSLLAAGSALGACTADFELKGCPDGTTQTAGGGDVEDPGVCTPDGQLTAGSGGAAGSAGAGGTAGATQGSAGNSTGGAAGGGLGGSAGGADVEPPFAESVLSAGRGHTCARASSKIFCWGENNIGQLGTSPIGDTNQVPRLIESALLTGARQLALGGSHSCVLRDDGRVLCWGYNKYGQLGGDTNSDTVTPTLAPVLVGGGSLVGVRQIALGESHSCALRDDGRVLCWGFNNYGQLGIGSNTGTTPNAVPTLINDSSLVNVRQIALGRAHSCALRDDGRVLCWGYNRYGQLGNGANVGFDAPNPIPAEVDSSALVGVRQLALGRDHSCALRDDGRVLCWGYNNYGQLGSAATDPTSTPVLVDGGLLVSVRQVAAGESHTCALRDDGRVLCWGSNYIGQLGRDVDVGSEYPNPVPTLVDGGSLADARWLVAGNNHTCALQGDGRSLCWGYNRYGQLGSDLNSGTDVATPSPTQVQDLPLLTPPSLRTSH